MDFDAYVADRRGALLRFATVLTGQAWLADDLVSDVLGRAYEGWDRIGAVDDPHAYVRRMIVNDHLSLRRRWARTPPVADIDLGQSGPDGGLDDLAERDANDPAADHRLPGDLVTDLDTLHRAFAELERRADEHAAADLTVRPAALTRRPAARRPLLIGATAAVLLAAVAGAVVVGSRGDSTGRSAPAAASPAARASATPAVATDLEARFRAALGDLATFTVTDRGRSAGASPSMSPTGGAPSEGATPTTPAVPTTSGGGGDAGGSILAGVLTAGGRSGGYDVQTVAGGGTATCSADVTCTVSTQPDGSSLAVGTVETLPAAGATTTGSTFEVMLVRPDGSGVLFHLGDQRDPKGRSEQLSPAPPLTVSQMIGVVTSPAWTD